MNFQELRAHLENRGYKVADERIKPQAGEAWKMPYCALLLGTEQRYGADGGPPLLLRQPTTVALFTRSLDRAQQNRIAAVLGEVVDAFTMEGGFIENGNAYESDFSLTLISKL